MIDRNIQVPSVPVVPGRAPAGMIPAEAALLTQWLALHGADYDTVTFNLRVGKGFDPGPDFPDYVRKQSVANTQRRIDAVLTQGKRVRIVEVKVRATLWAIGQLEGYRVLYMDDNPLGPVPDLLLLCGSIDDDTRHVYFVLGIPYDVIPTGA